MKKIISALFIIFMALGPWMQKNILAQNPTFRKSYNVTVVDISGGMVQATSGDYVFAGGGTQAILTNINSSGVLQWSKKYNSGFEDQFNDIKKVSTGGYILCGSSSDNRAILTRVDINGNLIWSMKYQYPDGGGHTSNECANAVIETSDGGFLVGGRVDYFWDGVSAGTIDSTCAMGFKVNATGSLLWNKVWTLTNTTKADEHFINDIAESADGYFFVGESGDETQVYDSEGDLPKDALLIKTDKSGVTQYIRRWGHGNSTSQGIKSAITLTTGNNAGKILLGGYDDISAFLITVNGTGTTPVMGSFSKSINGSASGYTYTLTDIIENTDGNYSLLGARKFFLSEPQNTIIVKINSSSGASIFSKDYAPSGLTTYFPKGGLATDGGYFMCQTDQQQSGFNFNVIKTDASGNIGSTVNGCVPGSFTPSTSAYSPTLTTPVSAEYSSMIASSAAPTISNINTYEIVHCISCVPPAAATTVSATPNPICAGQSSLITASGTATNVTYHIFTAATGGTYLGTTPLSMTTGITTTYYIETQSDADPSCISTTRTPVTVTVNSPAIVNAGNPPTICSGSSVTLAGAIGGGASGATWSGGAGTYNPNSSSLTASYTPTLSEISAGSFTLTLTTDDPSGPCSAVSDFITVTINPLLIVDVGSDQSICAGSSTTLTANAYNATGYLWSPATTPPDSQTVTVTPVSTTTYTLTVTDNNGCTASDNMVITVTPQYTIQHDISICSGQSYFAGGAFQTNAGTYFDTLQTINGCDSVVITNLTVNPVYIFNNPQNICQGGQYIINSNTYTFPGVYYDTLQAQSGCDSVIITNLTVSPAFVYNNPQTICQGEHYLINGNIYTNTGVYYDTLQTLNGCDSIIITQLNVVNAPVVNLGNDTTVCTGSFVALTAGGMGNFYQWSNGLSGTQIFVNTPGIYAVTVTNGYGCSSTSQISISNYPAVLFNFNTSNSNCNDSTGIAAVFLTGGVSPYQYLWSTGDTTAIVTGLAAGTYTLDVLDGNGCHYFASTNISSSGGVAISNVVVTDVLCFGGSNGAINITVTGGIPPYIYQWSNGSQAEDIGNLTTGPYEITVTDNNACQIIQSINVNQPNPLNISMSVTNASCGNADGFVTATVSGGIPPYTYLWSNMATIPSISNISQGVYTLTVSDYNACTSIANASVSETGATIIILDSLTEPHCNQNNGAIYISVSGGTSFAYQWSNNTQNQNLTNVPAGIYSVTVSNNSGCNSVQSFNLSGNIPLMQPICLVTVDTINNKNLVIWERVQTTGIAYYKIYRETTQTGVYQVVATVPYADLSSWSDPNSNPAQVAKLYRMSAVDSCGNEGPLSPIHKTIHLTISLGQNNSMNLIWNLYEGFNYTTNYIHRYHPSPGWNIIDSIAGDINMYTDFTIGLGAVKYKVSVSPPNPCVASSISKQTGVTFTQSLSNIEEKYIIVSQEKINGFSQDILIYPNPATKKIIIELSQIQNKQKLSIYNIHGQILLEQLIIEEKTSINISSLAKGMYFIRLEGEENNVVGRFVKE